MAANSNNSFSSLLCRRRTITCSNWKNTTRTRSWSVRRLLGVRKMSCSSRSRLTRRILSWSPRTTRSKWAWAREFCTRRVTSKRIKWNNRDERTQTYSLLIESAFKSLESLCRLLPDPKLVRLKSKVQVGQRVFPSLLTYPIIRLWNRSVRPRISDLQCTQNFAHTVSH